jgi:peroxiredoxin
MRKSVWCLALAACLLCPWTALAGGASESPGAAPLAVGAAFPNLSLGSDLTSGHKAYLGIAHKTGPVSLADLSAPVVVVEIFSMYCPHCQKEAPALNALFDILEKGGHADKVKFLGIGAGNSAMEVDIFRAKFEPRFPLVPDQDFILHDACGRVGTPFFYVLARKSGERAYTVVMSRLGRMDSPESFARDILAAAP